MKPRQPPPRRSRATVIESSSSSDDDDSSSSASSYEAEADAEDLMSEEWEEESDQDQDEEEEITIHEFRTVLRDIFPSKYLDQKIKAGEGLKRALTKDKATPKPKQTKLPDNSVTNYFNIILTNEGDLMNDEGDFDDEDEEEWTTDMDDDDNPVDAVSEHEDDPISSSSSEDDEEVLVKPLAKHKAKPEAKRKDKAKPEAKESLDPELESKVEQLSWFEDRKGDSSAADVNDEELEIIETIAALQNKPKQTAFTREWLESCQKKLAWLQRKRTHKQQKEQARNRRIFKKVLSDANAMGGNDYAFYKKLDTETQKKLIKEVREINKVIHIEKPYRLALLESNIPTAFKAAAMKRIAPLRNMDPSSTEYFKIKNWVDTFMKIPFGIYKELPITMEDGVDKCHDFMDLAQQTLNAAVYGLDDAKMQIMQLLGQLIANPKAVGCAVVIHGPMGTGKTSLAREGISRILGRPFAFVALGGATDSSFLEGHGYTYEGSIWGKIVQILIDSQCMNPVIFFDELDKISDTPKGEEIVNILMHLIDTSQNSQFHDKYFADIDFDLSKCLFVFSCNDESNINPILKDRMYRIQTKGYSMSQKEIIATDYLMPRVQEQVRFTREDILISKSTLSYLIEYYCGNEDGVRNLKRCLETIYTKLNLYRLMRPDSNLFGSSLSIRVTFPFTVTRDVVDKLIEDKRFSNDESIRRLYT